MTEKTSTRGVKTTYVYDERNRNTSITDTLGNVNVFAYDEAARLTSRIDAKGIILSYTYDKAVKVYNLEIEDSHTYYVSADGVLVHNACTPNRNTPHLEDGNLKEGWIHIDARHITGDHPKGSGDLFATGTTREQIEDAIMKVIAKGNRTTDPNDRIQVFQMKIKINEVKDLVRLVVDAMDSNRVITFFPVRGGE